MKIRKGVFSRLLVIGIVAAATLSWVSCTSSPTSTPPGTTPTTSPTGTTTPTTPPTGTTTPTTSTTPPATTPALPNLTVPPALIRSSALNSTQYVVLAWNDLGMHCASPSYDIAVLLPPYNNLWVQVIKRGNPPQIVTSGVTVSYSVINNTRTYGKGGFSGFWDNMMKLFGVNLARDTGLNLTDPNIHNGLSGNMVAKDGYFVADGIPLSPYNDDGSWNPYQVGQVVVKDASGKVLAQTDATLPISVEMHCDKCHGSNPFQDVLQKHDARNGTSLVSQEPVLCASCHGDPALGAPLQSGVKYMSEAMHGFHATANPTPTCYDCHPGTDTKCMRSLAHTAADGNCQTCHGPLSQVASSIAGGRTPWASEPKCATCHQNVAEVDTGTTLYRNDTGHGGVYCAACHSSPHAMVPTNELPDNYQALQYQGAAKAIGSCGACHNTSRGAGNVNEFGEEHGGTGPRVASACATCHTSVPTNTAQWPHAFQWRATQGTGSARGD